MFVHRWFNCERNLVPQVLLVFLSKKNWLPGWFDWRQVVGSIQIESRSVITRRNLEETSNPLFNRSRVGRRCNEGGIEAGWAPVTSSANISSWSCSKHPKQIYFQQTNKISFWFVCQVDSFPIYQNRDLQKWTDK